MLFNSFEYLIFFPLVFILYWSIKPERYRLQNILLIAASYVFYAFWDWRFLFLLIFSTSLDYFTGLKIFGAGGNKRRKKAWLLTSIIINLGFLGFFKYYNFFVESFAELVQNFGFQPNIWTLKILIPVGISFYTFHGLSYVLDIYNGKIEPTRNVVDYSLFVSFFPLLVAGPIERATHLLPQLKRPRQFEYPRAVDGLKQMLWGLFKKIVIADNCAPIVNQIFDNYDIMPANSLVLGAILFSFQIYGDFSGYSDIALGSARLLGIELLRNFSYPYFSRDIAEFWRRWHISLTTWFRDYIYIPLGGSRVSKAKVIRNTFIIFLVSGFWHGANWTFIVWGFLNAVYFLPLLLSKNNRKNLDIVAQGRILPTFREFWSMLATFALAAFGWIVFRAESITHAWHYVRKMFSESWLSLDIGQYEVGRSGVLLVVLLIIAFLVAEWFGRERPYALAGLFPKHRWLRYAVYYAIILVILIYGGEGQQFIYFQF
ncbi:MAG: MBOAT family protein [Dysgonamonadaceae bacterium]|jgi:D-alanyl-lipoteichoic acid acyltransferase DltB (MBOAT superfamily)|nr:MBOAT family protein [Dysgonamonadaceae bacterium]